MFEIDQIDAVMDGLNLAACLIIQAVAVISSF